MRSFIGLVYGVAALAACNPYLVAETPAPPGRSARLDAVDGFWGVKSYRIEISTGVALALRCQRGGPCEHAKLVSDNPAIVEVRPASLGVLERNFNGDAKTASAMVVIGKAAGTTTLHLSAEEGHRDVVVKVIPSPSPTGSVDRPAVLPGS